MLEFALESPLTLQRVFDSVGLVCNEANFKCSSNQGLSLSGMDVGHICLAKLDLRPEFFSQFRCDKPCKLGIHFSTLSKIIKCAERGEPITFLHSENSDELTMKKGRPNSDEILASYTIKLISLDADELDIPSSDNVAKIEMSSYMLQKIVKDLSIFGEDLVLECPYKHNKRERYLKISSSGDIGSGHEIIRDQSQLSSIDSKDSEYAIDNSNNDPEDPDKSRSKKSKISSSNADTSNQQQQHQIMTNITYGENFAKSSSNQPNSKQGVKLAFAAQYLVTFCKAAILGDRVTIHLGPESPIELEFAVGEFGRLSFNLAPRLTD